MSLTASDIERWLPDALHHLHDYSLLGTHPLVHLRAVAPLVVHDRTPLTHVDRGRALSRLLQTAIDELLPDVESAGLGRETHFHAILSQAYREGKENREIAANLAISERTFYRELKRALAALAQILWDMESGAWSEVAGR